MRAAEEDCNAGIIFDNLTSEYWENEREIISYISEALPVQNLQVLMFNFKQEVYEEGTEQEQSLEVCTNMRYAQRHDPSFATWKK